jgi:DNA-binding GntR family transcriptional regulator
VPPAAADPLAALPKAVPESRSAAAIVTDALRHAILRGTVPAGERLRQDAIATRFSVSQTIVREAFRQLAAEGLVKTEPRRGVSVAALLPEEAMEITRLRSLIEAQALEWAIPAMTKADLEAAERLLAQLDGARATDDIIALNARFHESLYAPSRRERTLTLIAMLRLSFERYLRFAWEETPYLAQSQKEHRELLRLCKARDVEAASALLKRHITGTGELLVKRLEALRG